MKRKKDKDWKLLRKKLRDAKHKIKKLEKSLGREMPTFHGFGANTNTTTLNGHRPNKHIDVKWDKNE